jgi:hypothetical protein
MASHGYYTVFYVNYSRPIFRAGCFDSYPIASVRIVAHSYHQAQQLAEDLGYDVQRYLDLVRPPVPDPDP